MSYSSIKGRHLGYDTRHNGLLANLGGFVNTITSATSGSTGTAIPYSGTTLITAATTSTWNMDAPRAAGVRKVILNCSTSTSTGARVVASTAVTFQTTTSSTYTQFSWIAAGGSITLESQSTSRWTVLSLAGATLA